VFPLRLGSAEEHAWRKPKMASSRAEGALMWSVARFGSHKAFIIGGVAALAGALGTQISVSVLRGTIQFVQWRSRHVTMYVVGAAQHRRHLAVDPLRAGPGNAGRNDRERGTFSSIKGSGSPAPTTACALSNRDDHPVVSAATAPQQNESPAAAATVSPRPFSWNTPRRPQATGRAADAFCLCLLFGEGSVRRGRKPPPPRLRVLIASQENASGLLVGGFAVR
jgi:hypothetical protein